MRLAALVAAVVSVPALAWAQGQTVVIKADRVLDGKGATLTNTSLVVQGTKITKLDPNATGVTYDLRGLTVMPGWIDTHAHIVQHFDRKTGKTPKRGEETPQEAVFYAVDNAYTTLLGGFTTVQSPGAELDKDLRDFIAESNVPGPRILSSFRAITNRTGTPDEIRAFVRKAVADGADFIKLFATASIREGGAQTMSDDRSRRHARKRRRMASARWFMLKVLKVPRRPFSPAAARSSTATT